MKKYKLEDIADFNKRTINKSDSIKEILYLDTSSITENVISDMAVIDINNAPSRAQRRVENNTIVYSTVRPRLKHYGLLRSPQSNLIVSTGFVTIDLKDQYKNDIDPRYLYLLLTQPSITEYIGNIADTAVSAYPSINPSDISSLTFNFPTLYTQKTIADIWESYAQKIALNRAINDNLEAMAKQLYDYWFIQFDFPNEEGKPYKSSGGKMVWSDELQMNIPHNWVICRLNDYIDKNNTGDWGNDTPSNNSIEVGCIRGADILKLNNLPRRYIKKNNIAKLLSDWDMVIEVSGGSPTQATGRSALITPGTIKRNGGKITCSNFCHAFSFKSYKYSAFFFFAWKMFYVNDIMFNYEGKTSGIKNFMTETFLANKWVMPKQELVDRFFEQIRSIYSQIDANIAANNHLTKQRDELLPLLMNGQVSVNYHLSVLQVVAHIGKFSYFIGPFSSSACRFEVDSPSSIFNGRGIRLPHFVFSGHLASQG